MEIKDTIAITGIAATLLVSSAALLHSLYSDRRTAFVNTVTSSRLKWIDSLRDQVSEFLAVTGLIAGSPSTATDALRLRRDTLLHQVILHLNPHDIEDQRISCLAEEVRSLTNGSRPQAELDHKLSELRKATADYLKKEWNRVKVESTGRKA